MTSSGPARRDRKARVSVLMACYNAERFLAEAIESVLAQTLADYELIIVDDGSSDRSFEIAARYVSDNVVLLGQKNLGAARARNAAFRHSRGEFVIFLDADDLICPSHLMALLECAARYPGCISLSKWDRFKNHPGEASFPQRATEGDFSGPDWLELDWREAQPMTQSGMLLLPRKLVEDHGLWNEELSLDDDFEFFARMISRSAGIRFAADAALYYRSAIPGSLSSQRTAQAAASAFKSVDLGTRHLLAVKDTPNVRRVCANLLQNFEYRFYPGHVALRARTRRRVAELGGADIAPDGPPGFHKLRPWIGWRAARLTQILATKAGLNRASRLPKSLQGDA